MPEGLRRRIPASCPLCTSRCGCEAIVESDRLVALEPDPSHPTGKALCAKGRASPELVEAPDRLLFPLRRTRPKGDPDRKGLGLIDRSRIIRHREHAVEPALGPAVFSQHLGDRGVELVDRQPLGEIFGNPVQRLLCRRPIATRLLVKKCRTLRQFAQRLAEAPSG